eukprot:7960994-Alexandrium_andersonii.AAC.1
MNRTPPPRRRPRGPRAKGPPREAKPRADGTEPQGRTDGAEAPPDGEDPRHARGNARPPGSEAREACPGAGSEPGQKQRNGPGTRTDGSLPGDEPSPGLAVDHEPLRPKAGLRVRRRGQTPGLRPEGGVPSPQARRARGAPSE